ncbi:disease resistance protein RPS4B-like [Hibiscus syriacus]|uniref:disease resistance protein RPS4B-like n=1 Tax=Hibiscus syriacus TaxID=106335 RepID=UPI001924B3E1|nr:disease resistance protein RPS4B-like [Hibiscus syriacus]
MGVKHFGDGSKIIITSRDKQVLKNGGADTIHEVKILNEKDSLQLFSTFAFKLLNPPPDFRDLSNKFLRYSQGNPLALKVLGSNLRTKSKEEWESEVDKLKECAEPKFEHIFKSSFDGLDEISKNIFLGVACFLKGNLKEDVEEIINCLYKGAASGISKLLDKSLLHTTDSSREISMHDMLEDLGKDIARQGSNDPGKYRRLWRSKDVNQVLKYNKGNESIEGIELNMSLMEDPILLCRHGFENMFNLRYLGVRAMKLSKNEKLHLDKVDSVSLPDQLRYLRWNDYPFRSLSPSFNPKNLVVLKLHFGQIEQLWNEDHQDLLNLRVIKLFYCDKLRRIPNLSGAINLESLICSRCKSLVELPSLNHLTSLKKLEFDGCPALKKFPELPNNISELDLSNTSIEEVPDSIRHLVGLRKLRLRNSRVESVSSNISKLESLHVLDLAGCTSLETLSKLPRYLRYLDADECTSLETVSFTDHCFNSFHSLHDGGDEVRNGEKVSMLFRNCLTLNQDSIKNIVANAMLQIQSLASRWARRKGILREEYNSYFYRSHLFCRFPGNEVPENVFCYGSMNSWLNLKITPNRSSGSRFLAFAICLVADFTRAYGGLKVTCKYQLKAAGGEKLTSVCCIFYIPEAFYKCDHVLVLFSENMIIIDNDYEDASFEFKIENLYPRGEIKVEECGVHVFYVDAESYTIYDVMRCEKSDQNFDSATKMRPEDDGEEGDGGPKILRYVHLFY